MLYRVIKYILTKYLIRNFTCIINYFWQTLLMYITFGLSYITFSYMCSLYFKSLE